MIKLVLSNPVVSLSITSLSLKKGGAARLLRAGLNHRFARRRSLTRAPLGLVWARDSRSQRRQAPPTATAPQRRRRPQREWRSRPEAVGREAAVSVAADSFWSCSWSRCRLLFTVIVAII